MREYKLVVLGAGGVGKTSLVVQYLEGFYSSTYKPTVEDYYRHTMQMPDGIFHTVEILDTSGSHHFPAMRELSIRSGRGFVLVFSVNDLQSFHEALHLWDLISKSRGPEVPVILVGNKSDLTAERKVQKEKAQQTAKDVMNNCRYIETSAKYNLNVSDLFQELLLQAKAKEQPPNPDPSDRRYSRRLSRRLSSLGSLPGLSLRRRSSASRISTNGDSKRQTQKCILL
ncbi:ras-related protein Rap-1b-like [Limulus polyphemus]|uniref:Ras-related protein Rap-1b-like n=1 Tax=Limulus polyphemus TaxID=6850 RepID=A0ABM1SR04_LIMPO|nr:ras-related protein Rap-1b-like [Limulus polyphemus]XP_022246060.1 ras-related protein Rap-1b-like [Limulus polyphemus]